MPPTSAVDQSPSFACRWRLEGREAASVRVSGELDLATAGQLEEAFRAALGYARLILLDLRAMSVMDGAGLHALLAAASRARHQGARIVLAGASERVEKLLDRTGSRAHLDVLDTRRPWAAPADGPPVTAEGEVEAITDAMVSLHLHCRGRAPTTAVTHRLGDDLLACTLGGISSVREFHAATRHRFIEIVERLSGRTVAAFISNYHVGPDLAVELFLLEPAFDARAHRRRPPHAGPATAAAPR